MDTGVQFVTIKSLAPLFRDGLEADRIELANCEEHRFDIVVQKGLYNIGDTAFYIQPDFCLPMPVEGQPNSKAVQLFLDFTMPDGDPKKSKLGKNGRIRAIKFNFSRELSTAPINPVYSVGILMPLSKIKEKHPLPPTPYMIGLEQYLDHHFEVTKYEEPETMSSGMAKGNLPNGMYSTDETNIKNLRLEWPMALTGTLKVDGSSITIYYRDDEHQGICSRNLEKKLDQRFVKGYISLEWFPIRKHYDREKNITGWMYEDTEVVDSCFYETPDPSWIPVMEEVDDTFVKLGKPVLEKLRQYCSYGNKIALRGELCGQGLKGSGNKNNPHAKLPQQIIFFAADDYSSGVTKRLPLDGFYQICGDLDLTTAPVIFRKTFNSWEELVAECEAYFKNNLVEGIVVKNDDATFSAKYMNSEYDSRK